MEEVTEGRAYCWQHRRPCPLGVRGQGRRRLDEADDYTRIEIEAALRRDIRVIPVLVGGARMPAGAELPEGLRSLTKRQNFVLPDRGWDEACRRLAQALEQALPGPGPSPPRPVLIGRRWQWVAAAAVAVAVASVAGVVVVVRRQPAPPRETAPITVPVPKATPDPKQGPRAGPSKPAQHTLLDLGLGGEWRYEGPNKGRYLRFRVERDGSVLRLSLLEPGHPVVAMGSVSVEPDLVRFESEPERGSVRFVARAKPPSAPE